MVISHNTNSTTELSSISTKLSMSVDTIEMEVRQPNNEVQNRDDASYKSSYKVKRNYLSMILVAYVLTLLSPRSILWSSSNDININNFTMYDSINILVLAKLTTFTVILIIVFLNLQGSDPGILTPNVMARLDEVDANVDCNIIIDSNNEDEEEGRLEERLPLTKEESLPESQTLYSHTRRKYCNRCQIYPPLRSHHCNKCKRCIATSDHHCVFLDTCIGERNHFRFWLFVSLNVICLHIALGIVCSSRHVSIDMLSDDQSDNVRFMRLVQIGQAITILAKLYMYSIYTAATLLWLIHTTIAIVNTTTFELTKNHLDYLRGTSVMDFPFGRGILSNIQMFFSRDDCCFWLKRYISKRLQSRDNIGKSNNEWLPILWKMPECIIRDSTDIIAHPWQNKYWSCC
jgi:hypothetical protein